MYHVLQNDLQKLDELLTATKEFGVSHLQRLNDLSPTDTTTPGALPLLPDAGLGTTATQQLFEEVFYPHIRASPGPRYWGFVTGGTTPAAVTGDWLTTVFDQNTQSAEGHGDASAALELHTVNLLLDLFGLSQEVFTGGMVSGATLSNFTGLATARQWAGHQQGRDVAREGMVATLRVLSATPHSSALKAVAMLGMGSGNVETVPVLPGRECVDIEALKQKLQEAGGDPVIFIGSGGTVNTVDYDDMQAIAALKKQHNFWWHLDAAFGAFATLSPTHAHLLAGWEAADSITVDCHKWLNVPYDSAVIFVRKEHGSLQMQTFQNAAAPYLGDPFERFNYLNFLPENSRRFRALPAWFTLMAYGKAGYREIVERNILLAQKLGDEISRTDGYELAAPVRLNTVCFTTTDNGPETINRILGLLAASRKLFITPTTYKTRYCLRAALVNWRTTDADVAVAVDELNKAYRAAVKE